MSNIFYILENYIFVSNIGLLNLIFPLGLSFYTIQQISYLIDCSEGIFDSFIFDYSKLRQDIELKWFLRKRKAYFEVKLKYIYDHLKKTFKYIDNVLYFLEQNPIKGFDKTSNVQDTAPIEILGYNSKGESNFVKDFSFNTKITPDLMNMISLGASAEGDAASIPFNNWNDGFKNRFEEKSEELKL